ncbi:uncharacterized protein F4807DRAFT_467289 [Annulohypoxylon truncatum]|uniref:uncharacterized protein n=1 Tax=Annulohypoxylon truncatum TaxID=327061 RepID=UPI002008AE5D|nr:uncharacterized protein F4807DRAFT_467289 [Annulohypoxylon truncatum]KAI1210176.1 hypothetical protein F4807DRAFT_467289 [Annulohypoxylon truncatum]
MNPLSILVLFLSTLHGATANSGLIARDHQPDSQTIAAYEKTGMCLYYYTNRQPNWNKGLQPCIKYCADHGGHGYSECDVSSYKGIDIEKDSGIPKYVDDDGFPWVAAPCKCENKDVEAIATEIIDLVAKALGKLDNILCAVFVSAIKEIVDVGLMFVPGGEAVSGAAKVMQYAKSAYENGMDAAGFYTDWVGQACGVPNWSFSLDSMFTDMVNAPDSMMGPGVASTGCLLTKNKSKCRKRNPKPDPKTSSQVYKGTSTKKSNPPATSSKVNKGSSAKKNDPPKATNSKATNSKTTNSKTTNSKTTDKATACKAKRAYQPEPTRLVSKFGDVEERKEEECNNGKTTTIVHRTTTDADIGYYIQDRKDIPKITCSSKHSQACYHYRSVMSRWSKTSSMTEWTCMATETWRDVKGKRSWGNDGKATNNWGATALTRINSPATQHWFPWANGFVYRDIISENGKPKTNKNHATMFHGCERDEFPPRYFWPGDDKAPKDMRQWVRFLPEDQNRGAGQLWKGFCNDHNAQSTKIISKKPTQTYVVSANLKSDKARTSVEQPKGKDKTIHSTVKVSTLRAIFSISEFEGLKANDDGLEENPCYPKDLVDDPGWALLTDDEWYKEHPASAKNIANYRKAPSKAAVDAAKIKVDAARKKGEKLDSMGDADIKRMMTAFAVKTEKDLWNKWVGTGDGQIPEELWGVLPSIPKFTKPKKRSFVDVAAVNDTLSLEDRDADDLDWDGHEDDVDDMDDEELRRWLEDYEEIMRRMYEDVETHTAPPEVPAEPTPVAPGERDLVDQPPPAVTGSNASGGVPQPTKI